jgi:hypothetical protein
MREILCHWVRGYDWRPVLRGLPKGRVASKIYVVDSTLRRGWRTADFRFGKKRPSFIAPDPKAGAVFDGGHAFKRCALCGNTDHLEVHHVDGNHANNAAGNLTCLCRECHKAIHRKQSFGKKKTRNMPRVSARASRQNRKAYLET